MKRKAQFFIATIVLISLAISVTAMNLYVPKEVNFNQLISDNELISNALFVKQTFNDLSDYFRINWLLPYTHRTKIRVDNDFELRDQTLNLEVDLPDNTYINSLTLIDEEGFDTPFNIEWSNKQFRQGTLYFKASIDSLSISNYFLYYNTAPSTQIINKHERQYLYGEDTKGVWFRSGNYYAWVDKSKGGRIEVINISGSDNFLNYYDHLISCNDGDHYLTDASNQDLTITPKDYYLKLEWTGSRFTNESYKVTELFFPDEIKVIDKMTMAADSPCDYWTSDITINRDHMINYLDSIGHLFEPTGTTGLIYVGNASWQEMYGDDYSVGLLTDNESPIYIEATTSKSHSQRRFIDDDSISSGTYVYDYIITPLVGGRYNSSRRYEEPTISYVNEVYETEFNELYSLFNNYFNDINSVITYNKTTDIFHEKFNNISDWYGNYSTRDLLYFNGGVGQRPLEASMIFEESIDPSSIIFYQDGPLPYQISTDNYLGNSTIYWINNSIVDNSLLFFSNGYFNATFESDGTVTGNTYGPDNNTPVSIINSAVAMNSPVGGFYSVIFSDNEDVNITSTSPKTLLSMPAGLSYTDTVYLLVNESVTTVDLTVTTYASGAHTYTLFNPFNKTIDSMTINGAGSDTISQTITPCSNYCVYRLEINNNTPFKINSNTINYLSTKKKYIINPYELGLTIINVNDQSSGKTYIYYNNESPVNNNFNSDLIYSETEKWVNNSFISFDFDDLNFIYKGVNWLNGNGWTSCTDSCTNSFSEITFVEKGSERVVVKTNTSVGLGYYFYFYPNTTYFKVKTTYEGNHSFGPGYMVNNSDDTIYYYKDSEIMTLNNESPIDKYNLKGSRNYITKGDELTTTSIIFNTNALEANNSIIVDDDLILIKAYLPSTYEFIINENPTNYLTKTITNQYGIKIDYTEDSNEIKINSELIS